MGGTSLRIKKSGFKFLLCNRLLPLWPRESKGFFVPSPPNCKKWKRYYFQTLQRHHPSKHLARLQRAHLCILLPLSFTVVHKKKMLVSENISPALHLHLEARIQHLLISLNLSLYPLPSDHNLLGTQIQFWWQLKQIAAHDFKLLLIKIWLLTCHM